MSDEQTSKKAVKKVTLQIEAEFHEDSPLFFRETIGSAETDDGTRYELSMPVGSGSVVLSVHPPGSEAWRSYILKGEGIVDAVIKFEDGSK